MSMSFERDELKDLCRYGDLSMKVQNPPQIGDKLFLFHREVIVIKTYLTFHLVKIRYINEFTEFCIDYHALSPQPDHTNSIGINKLRGRI